MEEEDDHFSEELDDVELPQEFTSKIINIIQNKQQDNNDTQEVDEEEEEESI
jgi:hypothetical protein